MTAQPILRALRCPPRSPFVTLDSPLPAEHQLDSQVAPPPHAARRFATPHRLKLGRRSPRQLSAKLGGYELMTVLIGYVSKRYMPRPSGFEPVYVEEIASVSDCIAPRPESWIDEWRHNDWFVYDTPEIARDVATS